ncbi:C40 family peptidase [Heyndrickxia sp. NPDC080065]|uniref:C40 family peptidase n=1 Tax=Heyndrickxia sp. NPDC080065 TaxID=3390568 RepID=UPI003D02F0DA
MNFTIRKSHILAVILSSFVLAISLILAPFGSSASAAKASKGNQVVTYAKTLEGKPYKYGGTTPKGFDASGYTQYVFKKSVKVSMSRTTVDQYKKGTSIDKKNLKAGDLVFFKADGKKVSFVGIYVGENQFIAATSKGVKTQSLTTKYWKDSYVGAKRILE